MRETKIVRKYIIYEPVRAWSNSHKILFWEHKCLIQIHQLFRAKGTLRAYIQRVTGKSHKHLYRDRFIDRPVKKNKYMYVDWQFLYNSKSRFIVNVYLFSLASM